MCERPKTESISISMPSGKRLEIPLEGLEPKDKAFVADMCNRAYLKMVATGKRRSARL